MRRLSIRSTERVQTEEGNGRDLRQSMEEGRLSTNAWVVLVASVKSTERNGKIVSFILEV